MTDYSNPADQQGQPVAPAAPDAPQATPPAAPAPDTQPAAPAAWKPAPGELVRDGEDGYAFVVDVVEYGGEQHAVVVPLTHPERLATFATEDHPHGVRAL